LFLLFYPQDSYNTEKALAWLTAAHAEERALRQALKGEVEKSLEMKAEYVSVARRV
jgi:hypothetical protein